MNGFTVEKGKNDLAEQSAQAAITKYDRLGDFNNRNLLSQSSGGCESKIKVQQSVSSEGPPPGSQTAAFPCPPPVFSLGRASQLLVFLLRRTPRLSNQGLPLIISSNLEYFFRFSIAKYSCMGGRVTASTYESGERQTFSL